MGALEDVRKENVTGSEEPLAGRTWKVMSELQDAWKEKVGKEMWTWLWALSSVQSENLMC